MNKLTIEEQFLNFSQAKELKYLGIDFENGNYLIWNESEEIIAKSDILGFIGDDYTKTKFGNELTYIIPSWCTLSEGKYKWILFKVCNFDCWGGWQKDSESTETDQNSELGKIIVKRMTDYHWLLYGLESAERNYKSLISLSDWKPQQARAVLPNALKTELVMTGTVSQWLDFLKLRLSTNAHPDAYKLAKEVKQIIDNKEWKNTLLNA